MKGIGLATPASENIYDVRDVESQERELLPDVKREEYLSQTAQYLYLVKKIQG